MPARSDQGDRPARSGRHRPLGEVGLGGRRRPAAVALSPYYWDWAWALASGLPAEDARTAFAAAWRSWHAAVGWGRGPAWHPYPAALRAWSFCGLFAGLVRGSGIEGGYRGELAALTGFLRRNLETDVGGNHLVKNLKALAGLAVFFGDDALLKPGPRPDRPGAAGPGAARRRPLAIRSANQVRQRQRPSTYCFTDV